MDGPVFIKESETKLLPNPGHWTPSDHEKRGEPVETHQSPFPARQLNSKKWTDFYRYQLKSVSNLGKNMGHLNQWIKI